MKNLHLEKKRLELALGFYSLGTYEDFDVIVKYLQKYFDAEIIESLDGPSERIWELKIKNTSFKLENDPYGNTLYCYVFSKDVMQEIYDDLIIRLKDDTD